MAAGLGFKTFTTGEVLTAADVNGYLMQGILVFANAAARSSAITSPQEGQYSFLKDTNALEYYDGAAWVGAPVGDITAVTAGTGISGGGSSGAVTITNDMATTITAAGDLVVGTGNATYDNLPIGTTGQVLTADTTVSPYKVKWAAASGGLTLIKTATFSGVADTGTTFDDVFSSTYTNYIAYVYLYVTTGSPDIYLQMRYAGPTTQTSNYSNTIIQTNVTATPTTTLIGNAGQAQYKISSGGVGSQNEGTVGIINFLNANDNSYKPNIVSQLIGYGPGPMNYAFGYNGTARAYTGFLMKYSAQNINGTISVYGVQK